jgi:hypothetical protein
LRTRLGTKLRDARVEGSRLIIAGADGANAPVWELNARTRRVAVAVTMPEFGAAGVASVVSRVWLLTADGHDVDVQP